MKKKFTRTEENFTCFVCGQKVIGNGYTDHCPNCLWSRHVDINPGDRESKCLGLMDPIGVIKKSNGWQISYRCQSCGYNHLNKTAEDDNMEKIIKLSVQQGN